MKPFRTWKQARVWAIANKKAGTWVNVSVLIQGGDRCTLKTKICGGGAELATLPFWIY